MVLGCNERFQDVTNIWIAGNVRYVLESFVTSWARPARGLGGVLRPVTVAQDAGTYRAIPGRNEYLGIFVTSWNCFQDVTNIWEYSLRPGIARYVPACMEPSYGSLWSAMNPMEPCGALWSAIKSMALWGVLWSPMEHYETQRALWSYGSS